MGHPFTLYAVLSAEYNLRYGPTPRIPYGCLVQLRPDVGSYSPTREGDIVTRAFHHYPRPADNAVGFYTVLTDATYGVNGFAPGRMPQCAVMVNIGLAVPTLSCMACMSYSGGSVKYTQVAVSAWDLHIETADHGRRHLRMARDLCPPEVPPQDGYVRIPAVLAHFRLLCQDNAAYAEALHKALYIFNMMERYLAFGDTSSWHSEHNAIAAMAADRALLPGKCFAGKAQWLGIVHGRLPPRRRAAKWSARRNG